MVFSPGGDQPCSATEPGRGPDPARRAAGEPASVRLRIPAALPYLAAATRVWSDFAPTPEEVYNRPNSPFVAASMGAGNTVNLNARSEGGSVVIEAGAHNGEARLTADRGLALPVAEQPRVLRRGNRLGAALARREHGDQHQQEKRQQRRAGSAAPGLAMLDASSPTSRAKPPGRNAAVHDPPARPGAIAAPRHEIFFARRLYV